jgi:transcriptional regulator with XRE-family HTH domain
MTTGQNDDVLAQRRRLRAELRDERKLAHLTQKQVAHAMDWSPSKMFRIETGSVGISVTDLRALLRYYNLEGQRLMELIGLARATRTRRGSR